MPFYRFHVYDPINKIDGYGHDGAALRDDIDAMLFAAAIVQRLVQKHPEIPRNWVIRVLRDLHGVGDLTLEAGCKVLLRPNWPGETPPDYHEVRG